MEYFRKRTHLLLNQWREYWGGFWEEQNESARILCKPVWNYAQLWNNNLVGHKNSQQKKWGQLLASSQRLDHIKIRIVVFENTEFLSPNSTEPVWRYLGALTIIGVVGYTGYSQMIF